MNVVGVVHIQNGHQFSSPGPTRPCYLAALPPELIDYILSFLDPIDLRTVSETCRDLYRLATSDHLWQALIQENLPAVTLTSPSPCGSYRELYATHSLRWFLPKQKLWFSDRDLTGKLIVARFDPRTGNIEAYQLVAAIRNRTIFHHWQHNDQVIIHSFEPLVKLHLDRPILRFAPQCLGREKEQPGIHITRIRLREPSLTNGEPASSDKSAHSSAINRFRAETPMTPGRVYRTFGSDLLFNNFMLARSPSPAAEHRMITTNPRFPYGNIWPPPPIPSRHRVSGARVDLGIPPLAPQDIPSCRAEMTDQAFRVRTWLEMRRGGGLPIPRVDQVLDEPAGGNGLPSTSSQGSPQDMPQQLGGLNINTSEPMGLHIGEEISTYATLDPTLYTPTPRYPYRGIWVGDYSGHGCEFLLIHQPEDDDPNFEPDMIAKRDDETDEEFAQRKTDETVYRGRLEAIKLTGDPNVPRGEYTFVVDDLGPEGFVTVVEEPPFRGARVVKSKGHVAATGFMDGELIIRVCWEKLTFMIILTIAHPADKYIESQLILISHDRLAQYWVGFGHISFFERVDIDKYTRV